MYDGLTVEQLYEILGELIRKGKGDYEFAITSGYIHADYTVNDDFRKIEF